ncbi:DUF3472 domain-containing protein [Pseudomonas sp. JDS28PS106]|uniref:DUF3472 domain-containing protein n=1 Tax=Pseudomonas sp. JDS28PS106 TaxID=2497235 RepID=UPI002FCEBA9F
MERPAPNSPQADTVNAGEVPTSGPYLSSVYEQNEAELIYVEQYVPRSGDNLYIYWSGCDFHFGPRGGYAGIQHQNNKLIGGQVFTYNNICSVWDLATEPDEAEVRLDYGAPGLHSSHFGGEGTGLHTSHPMPWHPDQWYGLVIRRWHIPGETVTRMAMFMYSYADQRWTHYMSASVPDGDVSFTGTRCSAFLERYAGNALGYRGIYGQHFRMGKNGVWQKPLYYEASAGGDPHTWNAKLVGANEQPGDANIMLEAGGYFDNDKTYIGLEPNQFDYRPKVVIAPQVTTFYAEYTPGVVHANWTIASDRPPQLSHQINIHELHSGLIIATNSDMSPHKRSTAFQTHALPSGTYVANVIIKDIFDSTSAMTAQFTVA